MQLYTSLPDDDVKLRAVWIELQALVFSLREAAEAMEKHGDNRSKSYESGRAEAFRKIEQLMKEVM